MYRWVFVATYADLKTITKKLYNLAKLSISTDGIHGFPTPHSSCLPLVPVAQLLFK